jgi:hypothetical protein
MHEAAKSRRRPLVLVLTATLALSIALAIGWSFVSGSLTLLNTGLSVIGIVVMVAV